MRVVPLTELDDADFAAALGVVQRAEHNMDPGLTPMPIEEFAAYATDDRTDGNRHERYAVIDDREVGAVAHLELELDDDNLHFASAQIHGAAEAPAAGRAAMATMVDVAGADGRTLLMGWGPDQPAEAAFWTSMGAAHSYTDQESDLILDAVDADLMDRWIEARHERADDVTLVSWIDRCPDEYLDAFVAGSNAMNDAPKGELALNDWTNDADDIRRDEDARAAIGSRVHVFLGLTPAGEPVGHTAVHENLHRPAASWQWDTVVIPAHRRRGIGRWLKAEMWRYLRAEVPQVTRLRTGNAADNDAMLAINIEMGFRPVHRFCAWQAELDTYRAALGD